MPAEKKLKNKLIIILGPTATGKTKLAIKLAKLFKTEIISADSRQVYQGMDVGTGKDLKEYTIKKTRKQKNKKAKKQESKKTIPYHLIDVASPKKRFALAQYQKLAYQAIDKILEQNKIPFLVGGTGLYLQAIIDNYQLTDVKPDLKLRKILDKKSLKELQALIKKYNLVLNQSDFNNKRRLIRRIEIRVAKKQENKKLKKQGNKKIISLPKYESLILGLTLPKKELDKKIDLRLKQRLKKEGLIEEVKKLNKQGLSWKKLEEFGLEYRLVSQYLQNKISYEEMAEKLAIAIHQFAKRQMTWFKRDQRIIWLKDFNQAKNLIKSFINQRS